MRLIIIGCEYSGTTTLSFELAKWGKKNFIDTKKEQSKGQWNLNAFHDHWKIPHLNNFVVPSSTNEEKSIISEFPDAARGDWSRTGLTEEEQNMVLELSPRLKEMFQRYHLEYHLQKAFYRNEHHIMVGAHIEEGIYAPLYFRYGGPGEYADRNITMRNYEKQILEIAPDTILILVKASPQIIKKRMFEFPHNKSLLKEKDIEYVLDRFEEEYNKSLIKHKITINTTINSINESFEELINKLKNYIPL
ncbi:MAG: hypothetical protein CL758_07510 [Chloroflexi bacterium]|nr:hypothetical protein [Chloroflexota bacterium]|tara:strand:- start:1846 stop:2589 length:744 start_codon:yes stop_codon:yes gene_type:complete